MSETTSSALALLLPECPQPEEDMEALFVLLEERIRRYTMGDSTSVPVETARRLLESILYCLELNRRFSNVEAALEAPLRTRWQAGVLEAKRIAKHAKLLLLQAQRTPPPIVNTAYSDTICALPQFFAAYDADFFAQEIPCSFDYPLCQPVSEALLGPEYMQQFLRRIITENSLLRAFSPEVLRDLYERYYVDYADLLVNLYLPVAEMATLCALTSSPVHSLFLSPEAFARAGQKLASVSEAEAKEQIKCAAAKAIEELNLHGNFLAEYTQSTALDLLVRLRASENFTKSSRSAGTSQPD